MRVPDLKAEGALTDTQATSGNPRKEAMPTRHSKKKQDMQGGKKRHNDLFPLHFFGYGIGYKLLRKYLQ